MAVKVDYCLFCHKENGSFDLKHLSSIAFKLVSVPLNFIRPLLCIWFHYFIIAKGKVLHMFVIYCDYLKIFFILFNF